MDARRLFGEDLKTTQQISGGKMFRTVWLLYLVFQCFFLPVKSGSAAAISQRPTTQGKNIMSNGGYEIVSGLSKEWVDNREVVKDQLGLNLTTREVWGVSIDLPEELDSAEPSTDSEASDKARLFKTPDGSKFVMLVNTPPEFPGFTPYQRFQMVYDPAAIDHALRSLGWKSGFKAIRKNGEEDFR